MSGHVISLVWEIEFPTATQKLLMLRVADYADDDGTGIYPSIPEVARQVGSSERQVQYAIKALEGVGLLKRSGGVSKHRTNIWTIDVDMLAQLALQEVKLNGSHDALEAVENEGAIIAPRTLARVQSRLSRVQSATARVQPIAPKLLEEPKLELRAGARATQSAARPSLEVRAGDNSWSEWLEAIEANLGPDARRSAARLGKIRVGARWPKPSVPMPRIEIIREAAGEATE